MRKLVLFLISFLTGYISYSQIQCGPNAGFEFGNFTGWQGDTGDVVVDMNLQTSTITLNTPGIFNSYAYWANNHQITSGNLTDWNTCYFVPYVCPYGGPYSARLGNGFMNCHSEDIYYTYRVDANNPILVYAFAPVLQDPNHPDYAQPAFISYVKDSVGNILPCTYYRVTATNLRGQSLCNDQFGNVRVYREWKNVAVDLSAYAGRNVTVYFQTVDCGFCGHYGYAYLDIIGCYSKQIDINHCGQDSMVTLTAPPGFDSYLWSTGQRTQSITLNVNTITTISCTYTTVTGCSLTMTINRRSFDPIVNFSAPPVCVCDNISTAFTDLTIQNQPVVAWEWDFGDNSPHSFQQNPSHQYLLPGIYTVSLIVTTDIGCKFGTTKQVRVYPCPTISMINHN